MTTPVSFDGYFKELAAVARQGDAREESYYAALAAMLQSVAEVAGHHDARVTTLPKPTDAGNPDFRVWNGFNRIVGYIEAKNPASERLDTIEESEQLRRYRATFPNLVLTNFFEFRLYRNGELVCSVLAARPFALNQLKTVPPTEKPDELYQLLDQFLSFSLPRVFTAEELAGELAKRTRFLREILAERLEAEKNEPAELTGFYEAFQTYLIGTLSREDFADLFAQTVTYGLFAARTRADDGFSRRSAYYTIPHSVGVLRDLFRFLSLDELPGQLAWCVDDIAQVLAVADALGILARYYQEGKGSDPVVHFYETFLAAYDPAERERRGVYYTPEPVVGYIVRSLHDILKSDFAKSDGLASEGVTLLDPAAGTMTFIARAARQAVEEYESKYGAGARGDFIRSHILKNFYAFELMMAPYAVGHLKMGFFLEELGHRLADNERVPFYLTNTLDNEELEHSRIPGLVALAEESRLAAEVKQKTPILVVLGNPPYSGNSCNKGAWITTLINDYKTVDGQPLGERNSKMLQDDYVKFLRFAQWKIDQSGQGVVGMITNHGYLENPTFRGMRQNLMRTFDEIYILDLHGNSLKKETCPDGTADRNVFDIRQGVAIAFFVKHGKAGRKQGGIYHAELYGSRADKYNWLNTRSRKTTEWRQLNPVSPFYLFAPMDNTGREKYALYPGINEVFPINSTGIKTHRDGFVVDFDRDTLLRRIGQFRDSALPDSVISKCFNLKSNRDWPLSRRRQDLAALENWQDYVEPFLYRPFDVRYLYYHPYLVDWPRAEVMQHMISPDNMALIAPKQHKGDFGSLATMTIAGHKSVAAFDINYIFPLYLYPTVKPEDLFSLHEEPARRANLNPGIVAALAKAYGREPMPEDIFHYIYAVLYAPAYRAAFAEFLKLDFPRIPFTADVKNFRKTAALGKRLTALHLLKSPEIDTPSCRFEGTGDGRVGKGRQDGVRYDAAAQRVYINSSQYFAPVPEALWHYRIGGYQVCKKWLKDRYDRRLGLDDIRAYCRIVTALGLTIEIQRQIDALYPKLETRTLSFTG